MSKAIYKLPESNIQPQAKFSIVWVVPIIAILIGVWAGFKAWSEMGQLITITFDTADGLKAGKTKIKYKNVEIGKVKQIRVNHDIKNVEVIAEMKKDISPFLTDKTRFWVVKARINISGISGLSTLLSGAYIGVDLGSEGKKIRKYRGLEIPPVVTGEMPGKYFILQTRNLGSIERDTPVYYRKFSVGRVEDVKLDANGKSVTIRIFVQTPYDQWINASTRFWHVSGMNVSVKASGIDVHTESLASLLLGGIAFEPRDMSGNMLQAENNSTFTLYKNHADALKQDHKIRFKYVLNFSESVRGLTVGMPIDFRGIQVGEVTDIQLAYNIEKQSISVPVTVVINYGKIVLKESAMTASQIYATHKERTDFFVKQGLRAQLQTGNMLTGQLFVALDFFQDAPSFMMDWDAKVPQFPTIFSTFGEFKTHISSILKKVDTTMNQVSELSYKLNHNLEPELSNTLKQTKNTLLTIQHSLKNDSPLQQNLQITLHEFTKAARSIKALTDYLERHPEALIQGKKRDSL